MALGVIDERLALFRASGIFNNDAKQLKN